MSRSTKKGPYIDEKLVARVMKQKNTGEREPIKTWTRSCTIIPEFVGHYFNVHNGRTFIKVYVVEDMVLHKLGEFAPSRVFRGHPGQKNEEAATATK